MSGSGGEKPRPSQVFLRVYREYLADRGELVLSIAEEAGQEKLRIALRGLWRRYQPGPGEPPLFQDIVEAVKNSPEEMEELRRHGILEITVYEGEPYIVVDVEKTRRLLRAQD